MFELAIPHLRFHGSTWRRSTSSSPPAKIGMPTCCPGADTSATRWRHPSGQAALLDPHFV